MKVPLSVCICVHSCHEQVRAQGKFWFMDFNLSNTNFHILCSQYWTCMYVDDLIFFSLPRDKDL